MTEDGDRRTRGDLTFRESAEEHRATGCGTVPSDCPIIANKDVGSNKTAAPTIDF
ncbi:hypothetical protein [Fodinicola feengrottensis]|uniref:Uncharacterized protein n=1 Tax=Fodinicola feengrottensis TaxID=435914 RepID=A0ABN2JDE4_9ACTN|nr:hypothetical protein [Fodinicola feengrottensis]